MSQRTTSSNITVVQILQNFIAMAHDPTQSDRRKNEGGVLMLVGGALSATGLAQLALLPHSFFSLLFPLSAVVAGYDVSRVGYNLINMRLDRAWLQGAGNFISELASGKGPNFYAQGVDNVFAKTLFLGMLARWILEVNRTSPSPK
eukprot:CAMPEP_0201523500 /NCGR_PEP_ID=MMETSP0161_2-20130828/20132_1 /ASSEMBLY_ACC=CAM_ASM_000251 /TAXON_ID=180227 /ORGANISM="Neoparamoeba aestuarina, Strain SoJaBio B1-5/56/2" /LENGTH=145 /DNA_ID=CAMNT_0047922647 /DNA_START=66 /DNA_END=503 /DNA_ORIENTATION=+